MNSTSLDFLDGKALADATMLPEYWGWWFIPIEGGNMERVNLPIFYHFGAALQPLQSIKAGDTVRSVVKALLHADKWLQHFTEATSSMSFPLSREAAFSLHKIISKEYTALLNESDENIEVYASKTITNELVVELKKEFHDFETVFERESKKVSVFAVPKKGIYDTEDLIEHAENSLPDDVKSRIDDQTKYDIKEAGKCLAFNTPTASGVHILKAVESLIRAYHAKVTGKTLSVKSRNWGAYIRDLNNSGADKNVTAYLLHIKDFYRNPIMHPEVRLTPQEAFSLFNASLSAIVQLDAAIQAWP